MASKGRFVTTPVINILQHDSTCLSEYGRLFKRSLPQEWRRQPIQHHKDKLGKQTCCFTTYKRLYVWEYINWRIYVHNDMGAGIEVVPTLTPIETVKIVQQYYESIQ